MIFIYVMANVILNEKKIKELVAESLCEIFSDNSLNEGLGGQLNGFINNWYDQNYGNNTQKNNFSDFNEPTDNNANLENGNTKEQKIKDCAPGPIPQ